MTRRKKSRSSNIKSKRLRRRLPRQRKELKRSEKKKLCGLGGVKPAGGMKKVGLQPNLLQLHRLNVRLPSGKTLQLLSKARQKPFSVGAVQLRLRMDLLKMAKILPNEPIEFAMEKA